MTPCLWTILLSCVAWTAAVEPTFETTETQVTSPKGTHAVIECSINDLGIYKVLWSFERRLLAFEDRRIVDDDRISVERPFYKNWNLHIRDVKPEDAGTYACQINTKPMQSLNINLLVPDDWPSPIAPAEVTGLVGTDVEIQCKLPDINDIGTWSYKKDEQSPSTPVVEDDRFWFRPGEGADSGLHTLVISAVTAEHAGLYFCRARSGKEAQTAVKVIAPPPAPSPEAQAESPNKMTVRWRKPGDRQTDVVGYTMYVRHHDTGKEYLFEIAPGRDSTGLESFNVGDLDADTVYTVQLAVKVNLGDDISMGKRSPGINVTTPAFIPAAPGFVKVKRRSDDTADVTWSPPGSSVGVIRGYRVIYTPLSSKKKPMISKKKSVDVMEPTGERWKVQLTGLRPKTRYQVRVAGLTRKAEGRLSKPLVYLHKALPPELSLNGRVLSDNSVLLTVTSLGSGRTGNIKMFYTEASQPNWQRLDFSSEWKFTVVGGLDPKTSYFFKVKAKIGGKMKQTVTHITTPPHDLLAPQAVSVSATDATSIEVSWDYVIANSSSPLPLGYIVHLGEETMDKNGSDDRQSQRQSVVFNRTNVEVKDLTPGKRYNIQVVAFNGFGEGPRTDGLLFHIAESEVKDDTGNKPYPPVFVHDLPEFLTIQPGETVKITCEADGNPVPEVSWFDGGEPIGESAKGSNQLYLANMRRSTVLTCRATSQWGDIEKSTRINVVADEEERETPTEPNNALTLGLVTTNIRPTSFTIGWEVIAGDEDAVERYQVDISDRSGRVLLSRSLPGQTSSFNLRSLQPDSEYRARLRAYGTSASGQRDAILAEADVVAFTPGGDSDSNNRRTTSRVTHTTTTPAPPEEESRYRLPLTVLDVTPSSARLQWKFIDLDLDRGRPSRLAQIFEVKVKSRSNLTLLTETFRANVNVMDLTLHPGQIYNIQVRVYNAERDALVDNITQVTTPTESAAIEQPAEPNEEEGPVLKRASLGVTTHAVTGEAARIDWTLAGARQEDIGQFALKVKNKDDRTLLRQDMRSESRSLTLSNLTPMTQYFVEVLALDDAGSTIAMATGSFTTTSLTPDETQADPTALRVYTEELDTNSVKVAWYTPPRLLPNLSGVTVQLADIANTTLLTQQMTPLTRSLTVRNLTPGEHYRATVVLKGSRGRTVRMGSLGFETQPTPGMPGRPDILDVRVANSTAALVSWRNNASPSPAAGSDDITAYVINFAEVDASDRKTSGTYQVPVYGSERSAVVLNLRSGKRYMFQVAARNKYSFGPLSKPVMADIP